jgi:hypothetical protein
MRRRSFVLCSGATASDLRTTHMADDEIIDTDDRRASTDELEVDDDVVAEPDEGARRRRPRR